MAIYVKVEKNRYIDSLQTLFTTALLNDREGIEIGYVNMANTAFKEVLRKEELLLPEIEALSDADFVMVARCHSRKLFDEAVTAINKAASSISADNSGSSFRTIQAAKAGHPEANICSIAVPGEYVLEEVVKALEAGLNCVVFSNNVPLEDERKMKELAVEKGLLCMGPDCGVANINGAALVLASINNRGPFGICGASGTGIQHVAAILHECATGISQAIGTGGNDVKEPVGGLMMQMGIDALEADPATKYLILISRKPADSVLQVLLKKVGSCKKPVVVFFMGCDKALIEEHGGIYASNLDDCAEKALNLIGKTYSLDTAQEIQALARKVAEGIYPKQKYLRGLYTGGTYMDEAMRTMEPVLGPVWSNAPLAPQFKLENSSVSKENTCVDYGEEEFTKGRPHPAIDPSVRKPAILKEAGDPEVAVILLDFILTPPGHMDPVGYVVDDIKTAMDLAKAEGRKLVFIGTILGTDADLQNKKEQSGKLEEAGVVVCKTNHIAARLATEIFKVLKERA